MKEYVPYIGLEIHVELKTRTKMFCDSLNDPDETHPNTNVCPICLGHPGTLPTINKKAVEHVLKVGLALGAEIQKIAKFDRKNYFYPDLPKGYQISQYDMPLTKGGTLGGVRIRRIHLEEDTGRNIHPEGANYSLVDFNRAGVPLMELVTEPDIHSAEEGRAFAEELQLLLRYLGVSDADMERGQMRLEANISVVKDGGLRQSAGLSGRTGSKMEPVLGTKVEVKNLNSFRALEEAIAYEIKRQEELLKEGKEIMRETRGWDDVKRRTYSQRTKEEAQDYRYFPEPDLPPLNLLHFDTRKLQAELPELPWQKRLRLVKEYGLDPKAANALASLPEYADFFENAVSELDAFDIAHGSEHRKNLISLIYNYLFSDLRGLIAAAANPQLSEVRVKPEQFAHLMIFVHQGKLSSRGAKDALKKMFESGADVETVVRGEGLLQLSDKVELERIVREVIEANPKPVADYKRGKIEALQFLKGQVMAKTKGSANPKVAEEILKRIL